MIKKLEVFFKEREEILQDQSIEHYNSKNAKKLESVVVCIPYFQDFYS